MPAPAPLPPVQAPRAGPFRRLHEWFWQSRALAALRAEGRVGPRAQELLRRAWVAVDLCDRALRPVPALLPGPGDGPARELARQAVFWALAAEDITRRAAEPDGAADLAQTTLAALWERTDSALLASVAGGEGAAHALAASLAIEGFVEFAELSREEQARQARDLAAFARALVTKVEAPRIRADKIYFRRLFRTGGVLFLIFLVLGGGLSARAWHESARDFARDRPYRTSSQYPGAGCKSPEQDCPESPFFFFHTLEEDRPWVEIDLGGKRHFGSIRIANREDCCGERAVPLVVEVSNDRKTWHEVARRDEPFNTWNKDFPPVSARYVRAMLTKKGMLHLRKVSVLR
jgi:hypothetical protein